MPKMHPLWLHFVDPSLEASFKSWHDTTWPSQAFEIIDLLLVSTFTLVPLILFTQWRLGNALSYRPLLFVVPFLVRYYFKTRPHLFQLLRWYVNACFSLELVISCIHLCRFVASSHHNFLSKIISHVCRIIRLLPCISVVFTVSEAIWFGHPIPLLLLPLPRLIISTCSLKSWREYLLGCTAVRTSTRPDH
jgi:hypothetical protein